MSDFEVGRFSKIEHDIVKVDSYIMTKSDPASTGLDGLFSFFTYESEEI